LLAAVGLVRLAALVRGPRAVRTAALAALTLAVLAQPVAADWRSMRVLGRSDTRQLAREWLVRNDRPALRAIIEPAVPARYYVFRSAKGRFADRRKQFVRSFIKEVKESRIDYVATLAPGLIDLYRRNGFCTVMTMSLFRGRAEHDRVGPALAYYDRLERESTLAFRGSPYKPGAKPVPFSFDLSYNYYPAAFARPGPEVRIYRLRSCTQRYGAFKAAGVATPAVGSGG